MKETMEQIKAEYDHLSKEKKELLNWWIKEYIQPEKHYNHQQSSYRLKHLFEDVVGLYLSNGQLKMAMLKAGYKPLNPEELNWYFRIRKVDIKQNGISFYDWCIAKNINLDYEDGGSMRSDHYFPKRVSDKRAIIIYLYCRTLSDKTIDSLNTIWTGYEEEVLNVIEQIGTKKLLSFYHWCIVKYSGLDNPYGDLAGDMKSDPRFPKTVTPKKLIVCYLKSRSVCKEAMSTFNRAWADYKEEILDGNRKTA